MSQAGDRAGAERVDCVFVYGTLRSGQQAHSLIAKQVVALQPATVPGRLYAFPAGYPGMVRQPAGQIWGLVVGELVTLSDIAPVLRVVDDYEGDEYRRVLCGATIGDGSLVQAWCYVLAETPSPSAAEFIASGDWLSWAIK